MSRNVSILSVVAAVMVVSVLSVATVAFAEQEDGVGLGQPKVPLCHNGHTISVGEPAMVAHLAHGDTRVACALTAAPSTTETTETTTSPTSPTTMSTTTGT